MARRGKRRRIRFLWLRGFEMEGGRVGRGTNERRSLALGCVVTRSGIRDRNAFVRGESLD